MTTSFPETKTGPRFGLASAALAGCVAMVLLTGLPVRPEDANPVLAKVNGAEIRQSDMALAEEELGPSLAQMDPATKQENVLSFLIDMKIVAKAAEARKIEDRDDFKSRLAFARNRLLMDSLLAVEGQAATTDEAMKKVYEDAAKQISGEQEVHARHILVETEDEAKAIEEELKKGADFAELAKKKSKDPGASDGGDLGFFTKEQMVPEFSAVAFALEPGKISDPVKSQFGWHIIKVEEKRDRKPPDFAQVKAQIETYVTRKAQADYVAKLRETAKVERMDQPAEAAKPDAAMKPAETKMAPAKKEKICSHFFEANSIYNRASTIVMAGLKRDALCPGHLVFSWLFSCCFSWLSEFSHVISRLPARPDRCPRNARSGGRKACDRGRGHPLQGPHRRAARGHGQGDRRRRRLHPVEMPVRAGGMVPHPTRRQQIFQGQIFHRRIWPRAGGEFRQCQCLHRQERTTGYGADRRDRGQGARLPPRRNICRLHRRDRRGARRHQVRRRARYPGGASRTWRVDERRKGDHDHRHFPESSDRHREARQGQGHDQRHGQGRRHDRA